MKKPLKKALKAELWPIYDGDRSPDDPHELPCGYQIAVDVVGHRLYSKMFITKEAAKKAFGEINGVIKAFDQVEGIIGKLHG